MNRLLQKATKSRLASSEEETKRKSRKTQIFIKLMNRGLRYSEYDKFPFHVPHRSTIRDLIDDLMKTRRKEFEAYFEDKKSKVLRKDVIVIVNGRIVVAVWKLNMGLVPEKALDTEFEDGDTVVFMIAVGGG
ncbi:MAG: MoaD/ThiS family protein [Candidatus Thorarchaeota archaeon]